VSDVTIIDYGLSNLGSMSNMLRKIGARPTLAHTPEDVASANKIILPGVGAFDAGMRGLAASGMIDALEKRVMQEAVPLLGVCLGMQLLGGRSEEGKLSGLGWIDAETIRFQPAAHPGMRVPHMGWNRVAPCKASPLIEEPPEDLRFYFANSYHVMCSDPGDEMLKTSHSGFEFASAIERGNIRGAQFHPEKSHRYGMWLLKNFVERC
jgi:glutamine amidotransferase